MAGKPNPLAAAKAKVAKLEADAKKKATIAAAKKQFDKAKAALKAATSKTVSKKKG